MQNSFSEGVKMNGVLSNMPCLCSTTAKDIQNSSMCATMPDVVPTTTTPLMPGLRTAQLQTGVYQPAQEAEVLTSPHMHTSPQQQFQCQMKQQCGKSTMKGLLF